MKLLIVGGLADGKTKEENKPVIMLGAEIYHRESFNTTNQRFYFYRFEGLTLEEAMKMILEGYTVF